MHVANVTNFKKSTHRPLDYASFTHFDNHCSNWSKWKLYKVLVMAFSWLHFSLESNDILKWSDSVKTQNVTNQAQTWRNTRIQIRLVSLVSSTHQCEISNPMYTIHHGYRLEDYLPRFNSLTHPLWRLKQQCLLTAWLTEPDSILLL